MSRAGNSIQHAASLLWELDENRLRPAVDYSLDLQNAISCSSPRNVAARRLFRFLSPQVWKRRTFGTFRTLLNRYDPRSISVDTIDDELDFLVAISETPCIRFVREWLIANGLVESTCMEDFCCLLMGMWFTEHARNQSASQATGFQHVFCGEINGRRYLSGLHNFVRVYLEEQQGNLRYMGYMSAREDSPGSPLASQHMLKIRFGLHGHQKHMSSMFFGVSPEFEVGLYSLISISGKSDIVANLGSHRARIRAVGIKGRVRTAYPQLLERPPDCPDSNISETVASSVVGKRARREASSEIVSVRPLRRRRTATGEGKEHEKDLTEIDVIDLTPGPSQPRCHPVREDQSDVIDLTLDAEEQEVRPSTAELAIDLTTEN